MQGFQPIYSGNTLTKAAGLAGQFIVQAGEARGKMWQSLGQTIGSVAQTVGTAYAARAAANAPVSSEQVSKAEAAGASFTKTDDGKVTTKEWELGLERSTKLMQLQTARLALQEQKDKAAIRSAGVNTFTTGYGNTIGLPQTGGGTPGAAYPFGISDPYGVAGGLKDLNPPPSPWLGAY